MNRVVFCCVVAASTSLIFNHAAQAGGDGGGIFLYESTPYYGMSDSPIFADADGFWLEDFEDGQLNSLGLSADAGQVRLPHFMTDSVDGDDGVFDSLGQNGHSYFLSDAGNGVTFTFDEKMLGGLPTAVGLVWTDGVVDGSYWFEAYDGEGEKIESFNLTLGDLSHMGTAIEDRFVGAEWEGGISAFKVYGTGNGIEVDHVQYGYVVPTPGALALLGIAGLIVPRRRKN